MQPILEPLIYVSDLSKSIEFYRDALGFLIGELFPNQDTPTYAPVFIGDNKLMLCLRRDTNAKFYVAELGGSGVQFFVKVDDVDQKYSDMKDKVKIIDEISTKDWGDREFTITDPDGYLISFYTPSIKST